MYLVHFLFNITRVMVRSFGSENKTDIDVFTHSRLVILNIIFMTGCDCLKIR